MATLCKNCSHALVFNPASQLLECSACGSMFRPEEVEAESKEYREDLQARSMATRKIRASWTATFIRAASAAARSS